MDLAGIIATGIGVVFTGVTTFFILRIQKLMTNVEVIKIDLAVVKMRVENSTDMRDRLIRAEEQIKDINGDVKTLYKFKEKVNENCKLVHGNHGATQ